MRLGEERNDVGHGAALAWRGLPRGRAEVDQAEDALPGRDADRFPAPAAMPAAAPPAPAPAPAAAPPAEASGMGSTWYIIIGIIVLIALFLFMRRGKSA